MTTVVLCGEREDTGIRRILVRVLSRYGGQEFEERNDEWQDLQKDR